MFLQCHQEKKATLHPIAIPFQQGSNSKDKLLKCYTEFCVNFSIIVISVAIESRLFEMFSSV